MKQKTQKGRDAVNLEEFKLERYFARYEFNVKYLLSPSDCENIPMGELLEMADAESRGMWEKLQLQYTESQGHPVLREEISGLYKKVKPQDVLVVTPEEGVLIAMNALLKPGDHVIYTYPAYQSLYAIPQGLGCEVTPWPVKLLEGKWQLDIKDLERSITEKTKLLIVNFPHNPTGYLPDAGMFDQILQIARRYDLTVFSDEMYWMSEPYAEDRLPAVADVYEKGISLFGLSKTFGLPGLRIGWLAVRQKELLSKFLILKDYTTICSSAPSEILAIMALRNKERIVERSMKIIEANRKVAEDFFGRHDSSINWISPRAGSVAFPRLLGDIAVDEFCQDVVETKNLMVLPASVFEYPGNHFRVGLGRESLPEALEVLDEYLRSASCFF